MGHLSRYKYHDFNKHITWVDMGAAMPVGLGVNKDTFDSLPSDLQQLMIDVADEAVELNASLILERRNAALVEWEELGITRHEMPVAGDPRSARRKPTAGRSAGG